MKSKNYLHFVHGNPVARTLQPVLFVLLGAGSALAVSSYLSTVQLERTQDQVASLKALVATRSTPQIVQAQTSIASISAAEGSPTSEQKEEPGLLTSRPPPQAATPRAQARQVSPTATPAQRIAAASAKPAASGETASPTATAKPHASAPAQGTNSKPALEPARIATPSTVNTTFEQAGIAGMDTSGVEFRSGRRIAVGGDFPSGERLISVDPGTGRIVTDKRVIVLKPGEASHAQ